jgi:hypothetical protein
MVLTEPATQQNAAPVERRSAGRVKNVAQLPVKSRSNAGPDVAVNTRTGTDGEWAEF